MGGQPRFKASFKYDLLSIPEETTPRMYFLSEVLKLVVPKLGVNVASLAMVFPEADTLVRYFEMPLIPETDMRTAVGYEAQKFLPFAMRELYFDYRTFPKPQLKRQGVVLSAAKKEAVDLWKHAIAHAGYVLDFLEPEGMAFFRLVGGASPQASFDEVKIYAGLRQGGFLTFIAARGSEVLMSNTVKIPPPMAIVGQEPKKIDGDAVARQISLLLNYFVKNFRGLKVRDLEMTVDPGSAEDSLEPVLKAQLSFPVKIVSHTRFFVDSPAKFCYAEMVASAAAKGRAKHPFALGRQAQKPMNLMAVNAGKKLFFNSTPLSWEQEVGELKRLALTEACAVAVFFLALHLFFLGQIGNGKKNLARIAAQEAALVVPPEIVNADDLDAANESLIKKTSFFSSVYGSRVYWTPKLAEIGRCIPEGVVLDVLEIVDLGNSSKTLRLEGRISRSVDDVPTVNRFLDALRASPALTAGIGSIKISKLKKIVDAQGVHAASIFFVDSEPVEKGS